MRRRSKIETEIQNKKRTLFLYFFSGIYTQNVYIGIEKLRVEYYLYFIVKKLKIIFMKFLYLLPLPLEFLKEFQMKVIF